MWNSEFSMENNSKPIPALDISLMDKITTEKGALEIHKSNREDMRLIIILKFIAFTLALTFGASFIPGVGFENATKLTLPVITFVAGLALSRPGKAVD